MAALQNFDSDMPQYIADNTDDEQSHAAFMNAYLKSKGAHPVNLDEFRTLPSSKAICLRRSPRSERRRSGRDSPPAGDPSQRHRHAARAAGQASTASWR